MILRIKYIYWLIPKFILIAKRAKLIPERSSNMIIKNNITKQGKEIFTNMLYNREVGLDEDFIKMRKIKRQVVSL